MLFRIKMKNQMLEEMFEVRELSSLPAGRYHLLSII